MISEEQAEAAKLDGPTAEIRNIWRRGVVPPLASLIHARWWQLETWLRELVYVELRAKYGTKWVDHLSKKAADYEKNDKGLSYMASADAGLRIAYLDVGALLRLIDDDKYWPLFEDSLIDRNVWHGRVIELQKIRRHIAHCRRPHTDDLSRLEQTLRDLESGAYRALSSYNRQYRPHSDLQDPLVEYWVREGHSDADLVDHAARSKGIHFELRYSMRPWTPSIDAKGPISGNEGYLWHASFYMENSRIRLDRWWREYIQADSEVRDRIVLVACSGLDSLDVTFSAVDDVDMTANVIGHIFRGVLRCQKWHMHLDPEWEDREMLRLSGQLDPRVQLDTAWSLVDDTTKPISVFMA